MPGNNYASIFGRIPFDKGPWFEMYGQRPRATPKKKKPKLDPPKTEAEQAKERALEDYHAAETKFRAECNTFKTLKANYAPLEFVRAAYERVSVAQQLERAAWGVYQEQRKRWLRERKALRVKNKPLVKTG